MGGFDEKKLTLLEHPDNEIKPLFAQERTLITKVGQSHTNNAVRESRAPSEGTGRDIHLLSDINDTMLTSSINSINVKVVLREAPGKAIGSDNKLCI